MLQPLTPAAGSKVGHYSLAAEAPEALSAPSFVARTEDGRLARVLLLPRLGVDVEAAQRAAEQAKSLTHANVLQVLDVEPVEGRVALALEHTEGVSLQTLLTAAGASGLSRAIAYRVALDVIEGLAAAHGAGLAHGEVGPHLVLVGTDGQARLIGIGVAKCFGKALAPKTPSDRLAYIAPERVKTASTSASPAVDPKSDVFSAAVVIWELLARTRLFAGRLESAVIQKVLTAPVAPLAATSDDLPDGMDELLKKALERDPARRTATARELSDGLLAVLEGKAGSHEDVARVVEELAKKQIEDVRSRVGEAPANGASAGANGAAVPPARASFPTLDESWIESVEEGPKPVIRVPGAKPPSPPKPPPKPPSRAAAPKPPEPKPLETKPAETKPDEKSADDKPAEAKTEEPAEAKAAEPAEAKAEDKPADAKPAEAKPADEKAPEEKPAEAKAEDKPAEAKPGIPKAPAKRANIALPTPAAKRPLEVPRKGTLLGMAPPPSKADAKAGDVEPPVATPRSPMPGALARADAAEAKGADAGKAAKEGETRSTKSGPVEAAAPTSKPTPVSGSPLGAKSSSEPESTPESASPSLLDRKKRAMPGNLKPGDTLGRYELLLPVAAGGMAAVWAARLQGTAGFQKIVAIKTMLPGLSSDQDFEEMFLDEARVAARIRHPNVVEIFDLGEEDETLYLVMEWVEGETIGALQKGSKAHGGVPLPILLRLASQACAGLHAAHELRDDKGALVDLVHRDISPANILVSRTGFVKIVDFGVAKSKARMYTTRVGGMIKGKTPYLSPEQLAGQPIDRRSDLFSFGAVLYVLATGLHPFRGETEAKTIENIVLRDPVPLRKIDPNLHPDLEAIVIKALHRDREQRYQSASEMQRAIDTLAASIGQTVNDDDVAAFVKLVAGDNLEKRAAALREAIATADTGRSMPASRKETPADVKPEAAATADDPAKVEIDDVDVDADAGAQEKPPEKAEGAAAKSDDAVAALLAAEPAVNAASLGSDAERVSPPDTLAAASTEPAADADAAPPRRKGLMYAVGGVLGVCALIGVIALAGSSGGDAKGSGKGASTTNAAAQVRTGQSDATSTAATPTAAPTATAEPTATATAEPTATATAEPTSTATAEPVATAEPPTTAEPVATADTPPTKATGGTKSGATTATGGTKTGGTKTGGTKTGGTKTGGTKTGGTKPGGKWDPNTL